MSMSARQQLMLQPRLTSSEMDRCANKEGQRRTIYFTKKLPGDAGYRRTGQYLGEWQDNKWSGNGTHEMANGNRYIGAWAEGKRHGMGTLWVKREGQLRKQYAGQWQDDLQHGRGVFHYKNGDNYNGEWKGGVRHGVGIMTYITGDVYEGEWFNDQRHGFGVLDYVKGDHFEGMWVEDKKEGEGVHFYFNKEKATHTRRYDAEWPCTHPAHTLHMPCTCPAHTLHIPCTHPPGTTASGWTTCPSAASTARCHRTRWCPPPQPLASTPAQTLASPHTARGPRPHTHTLPHSRPPHRNPDPNPNPNPNPNQVPASEVPDSLPAGKLRDSRGVISSRLAEIREERKHHRATR